MAKDQTEVELFGTWSSPYVARIHLALKLKGIPYDYREEDLSNKSELLLRHNPVHKKVPVLVHRGKPVAESLIILEYIDECWIHGPKLLPDDPHQRAKVRFWANFYDQKVSLSCYVIALKKGDEQRKAIEEFYELLSVFEEGIQKDFPERRPFFNGENLGFLDIVVGSQSCHRKAFEEATGVTFDAEKCPIFSSWVDSLKEHPIMKETLPPVHKLVPRLKNMFSRFQA
ncbi:hypothetical protein Ancab_039635 [Ancistrocladus abbreviatus]